MSEQLLKEILSEITLIKSEITTIKSEITTMKSTLCEHSKLLHAMEHRIEENSVKITSIEENMHCIDGRLTKLERHSEKQKSDFIDLKTKVERLETKIEKMDAKLDHISETQNKQSEILDVLSVRSIYHEAEIKKIKRAQ